MISHLVLGSAFCLMANVVFYLSLPNQQWLLRRPWSFNVGLVLTLVLLLGSGFFFSLSFSPLATVFTLVTLVMLLLGIIPLITRYVAPKDVRIKTGSSLTRDASYNSYQPQWWLKTLGAFVLSFPFAVFSSSLIGFIPFANTPQAVTSQFQMWLIVPIWLTPLSLIFFAKKPWRVFLVIALVTVIEYVAIQQIMA